MGQVGYKQTCKCRWMWFDFKELFNLLRNTLYPKQWDLWTIDEIMWCTGEEEAMRCIYAEVVRKLWVSMGGEQTFRVMFAWDEGLIKRRDERPLGFGAFRDGSLRAGEKCQHFSLTLDHFCASAPNATLLCQLFQFVIPLLLFLHVWLLFSFSSLMFLSLILLFFHIMKTVFICCWSIILMQFSFLPSWILNLKLNLIIM